MYQVHKDECQVTNLEQYIGVRLVFPQFLHPPMYL